MNITQSDYHTEAHIGVGFYHEPQNAVEHEAGLDEFEWSSTSIAVNLKVFDDNTHNDDH